MRWPSVKNARKTEDSSIILYPLSTRIEVKSSLIVSFYSIRSGCCFRCRTQPFCHSAQAGFNGHAAGKEPPDWRDCIGTRDSPIRMQASRHMETNSCLEHQQTLRFCNISGRFWPHQPEAPARERLELRPRMARRSHGWILPRRLEFGIHAFYPWDCLAIRGNRVTHRN